MTFGEPANLESEKISELLRHWQSRDSGFAGALLAGVSPPQALARLGVHLCMRERYPESLQVFRAAISLAPDDPALLTNLAVVLERAGQTDEAIHTVERSLALSHAQPDSWIFLGNLKKKQRDLLGAQAAYEAAISLETTAPLAWQCLGLLKQEQRKYPEAIDCIATCIRQSQATAPLLAVLGQLFYSTGRFEESRNAYGAAVELDGRNTMYRRMRRETQFLCAMIDGDSPEAAIDAYELDRSASGENINNGLEKFLQTTFALLNAHGHQNAAARLGARRLALFPNSATAAYLLQAVAGDCSIPRSPDAYLVEYFNEFADRFDQHLVDTLAYDIPRKLAAALAGLLPANARVDVLDAGCGTGLCGPWLRPVSASLTGVDLSPNMLEHADRRQIYDRLVCGELTSFLMESPTQFDVIIAADVMIYFGDLTPLSLALSKSLKPGGLLAFSTERAAAPGHQLLNSGRFAHHPDHVRAVFHSNFVESLVHDTPIRLEACRPVAGNIFVFRRR